MGSKNEHENKLLNSEEIVDIKQRKIISPWRNVAEFRKVSKWIYGQSANQSTWEYALDELKIWINRRRSQCPAAVYATHAMLEIKLTDSEDQCRKEVLQSLYAFGLVRFFNFMSSTIQTHTMRSMYATAIELGLESFVVDIRHICAHGTELPELSVLRRTADYCLRWLHDYFWHVQSEKMIDAEGKNLKYRNKSLRQRSEEIENLFNIYDMALECHLNHCKTLKDAKKFFRGRRLGKLKFYWQTKMIKSMKEIFDPIVMDMHAITKCGLSQRSLSMLFVKAFLKMKYFFTVAETHNTGSGLEELFEVVQNLFRFFAVYKIADTIVKHLFEIAESSEKISKTQRTGAGFWVTNIVDGFLAFTSCRKMFRISFEEDPKVKFDQSSLNFGKFSKNVRETYIYSGIELKSTILFGDSFQRPWVWKFNRQFLEKRIKSINDYTLPSLPCLMLLTKPKMSDAEIVKLNKLMATYLMTSSKLCQRFKEREENSPLTEEKIFTLSDLSNENRMESIASEQKDSITEKEKDNGTKLITSGLTSSCWSNVRDEYDEYDWSKCPIGRLPWQ